MGVAVLIIFFIYMVIIGFFIMNKLDKFISNRGFVYEKSEKWKSYDADAVVYVGKKDFFKHLNKNDIIWNIVFITEIKSIYNEQRFKYLFAFSENDLENLLVCLIAKKIPDGIFVGAVCNDIDNKRFYEMFNIHLFVPNIINYEYIGSIINDTIIRKVSSL